MISIINEWNPIKSLVNKVAAKGQESIQRNLDSGGADIAKERLKKLTGTGLMAKWANKTNSTLQGD